MSDEQPRDGQAPALRPDPRNARLHPERNQEMIRRSLEDVGAFRSIAVDGEGIVRAGNGVYEQAQALGLRVRIVDAQPDELIAVRRPDLVGEAAERAALYDNRANETSLWSLDVLDEMAQEQPELFDALWTPEEWAATFADDADGEADSRPVLGLVADADEDTHGAPAARSVGDRPAGEQAHYPLPIVLTKADHTTWQAFKKRVGVANDTRAFLLLLGAATIEGEGEDA